MANSLAPETSYSLLSLSIGPDWSTEISASPILLMIVVVAIIIALFLRWKFSGSLLSRSYEIDSAELGVGDSKVTFKPNLNDKSIAYKIWVELSTRKIGLPIDFDDDVIAEIYDSWYSFFAVTRELIKDIPIQKVRNSSTKKIIILSIDVLNLGLRPHLTKWQARFRRWYDYKLSIDVEAKLHPQDLQKEFPDYQGLVQDMAAVNARLIKYRDRMNDLVHA